VTENGQNKAGVDTQDQATPDSFSHLIETGRTQGFHTLIENATKYLLPLEYQSDEENGRFC
jgi:hypothetical protein